MISISLCMVSPIWLLFVNAGDTPHYHISQSDGGVLPISSPIIPSDVDADMWNEGNDAERSNAAGKMTVAVLLSVLAVLYLVGVILYLSYKHLHPEAYNIKTTALQIMVNESCFGADEMNVGDLGTEGASGTGKMKNVEI